MKGVRWATSALNDLDDAVAYRAAGSAQDALSLYDAIQDAVDGLAEFNSGRIGRVRGTFEKIVRTHPYIILFETDEEEVRVLRIVHGARYWPAGAWPPT